MRNHVQPAVVVVRHPDFADDITVYGVEDCVVVYIDQGAEFNGRPDTREQFNEWSGGVREQLNDLRAGHPARAQVDELLDEIGAEL